jgi:hypothetical protein
MKKTISLLIVVGSLVIPQLANAQKTYSCTWQGMKEDGKKDFVSFRTPEVLSVKVSDKELSYGNNRFIKVGTNTLNGTLNHLFQAANGNQAMFAETKPQPMLQVKIADAKMTLGGFCN